MEIEIQLDKLMKDNNIRTIEELREKSKLSRTVLGEILNGKRHKIRFDTIAKLCQALNCEIGDLLKINKGA